MKLKKNQNKVKEVKNKIFSFKESDFSKKNIIEGAILRPLLLLISFATFIFGMFLLLFGNLKWGGSGIIFSFILNLYAIYISLTDEASIFRTLNIAFKLVLFISEIIAFNYLLTIIL